ncbi:hypothetical protein KI387_033406, partial [Taxus chinensis]
KRGTMKIQINKLTLADETGESFHTAATGWRTTLLFRRKERGVKVPSNDS